MSEFSSGTTQIEAPIEQVSEILNDVANYPSWSSTIKKVEIDQGSGSSQPTKVTVKIEAGVLKDRATLIYDWSQAPEKISFSLEDADLLTEMSGSYLLKDNGDDTTDVTYQLKVAISMPVPEMMRKKQEESTISQMLAQLKSKAES